jgi:hypothetical protein
MAINPSILGIEKTPSSLLHAFGDDSAQSRYGWDAGGFQLRVTRCDERAASEGCRTFSPPVDAIRAVDRGVCAHRRLVSLFKRLLGIDWRGWMTETFVKGMFRGNALYYVMRDRTVDNPDQRISEEVNSFTSGALNYSMTVLQAIVTAIAFFGILWSISQWLAISLIAYALAGTWLAMVIGRRLVVINF